MDILECPVSERCLARESANRAFNLGRTTAAPATAAADRARIGRGKSMPPALTRPADRIHDSSRSDLRPDTAGKPELPADQPGPASCSDPVHGLVQQDRKPLIRDISIACWRLFSDLDLSEAHKTSFKSLHDCFTREFRPGLRPLDPDPAIVVSPCDAIIGAHGKVVDTELFQIKGAPYSLRDLLGDPALVERTEMAGSSHCG